MCLNSTYEAVVTAFDKLLWRIESTPGWLQDEDTIAIRLMKTKAPRTLEAITCLLTIHKALLFIVSKKPTAHLEDNNTLQGEMKEDRK